MIKKIKLLGFTFIVFITQLGNSQSILGKWKTIDDRHGMEKAIIEMFKKDDAIHGRIVEILQDGKKDAKCMKCTGKRKDKPILGMMIIEDLLEKSDGEYKGNTLFDPEQAMTFRCKIWLNPKNPDELKVRGYLSLLYRTQTWIRVRG